MEFYEVINRRHTVREWKGDRVPQVVENIFLAAMAEGLACSMRIPVGEEDGNVTAALGVPEGYMMPCYIGIGYPAENTPVIEQVNRDVKSTLHFGKW